MNFLEEKILTTGVIKEGNILKVDSFLNHQIDIDIMRQMAYEFKRRFRGVEVNKVLTIEASGIAPAIMTGYVMGLPVVFAKKKKPVTMEGMLSTEVYSFTKRRTYDICVSGEFVCPGDRLLFIDDFLANGNAAKGIADLARQAGAELAGMGFIIEKEFQHGGKMLRDMGFRVESLAVIESLDNCRITFKQ